MSAEVIVMQQRPALPASDRRVLLPIDEVAGMLDVSVALLKRQHLADPAEYPAVRVGVLWRIPRAWVEQKIAWPREAS